MRNSASLKLAVVKDVSVELQHEADPFGQILFASIRLRGPVFQVLLPLDPGKRCLISMSFPSARSLGKVNIYLDISPDEGIQQKVDLLVLFSELISWSGGDQRMVGVDIEICGLVLALSSQPPGHEPLHHRRIGYFEGRVKTSGGTYNYHTWQTGLQLTTFEEKAREVTVV